MPTAKRVTITVEKGVPVSGLVLRPREATAWLVLAHGAGAGMTHPFMMALADDLAARKIATLRYQFPYMESGSKRPDRPNVCHATVRAAVAVGRRFAGALPLFAGGKSFGGRMTSQTQADSPLPGVVGLVLVGFPLHTRGSDSLQRALHLASVGVPLLFLQGTRDALAQLPLMTIVVRGLGDRATLQVLEGADHSFHVLKRSGSTDDEVRTQMIDAVVVWATAVNIAGTHAAG